MTAMVAHPGALWPQEQRRSSQVMNMSPVGMPAMVPTSQPQTSRPYQTSQMELNMPLFGAATSMAPSMSFQSGAYGFDLSAMNQYPVQQPLNFSFQSQLQHATTFPQTSSEMSPSVTVTEARTNVPHVHRSPSVKSEPSPIDDIHTQVFPVPTEDSTPATTTEITEAPGGIAFNTDIDCLMRTIQAKSQSTGTPVQQEQAPQAPDQVAIPEVKHTKARKRYQCSMPNCNKSFYQKTHLEIHTRAHTGVKPFICKEPACGQRFSQLGNLKVS